MGRIAAEQVSIQRACKNIIIMWSARVMCYTVACTIAAVWRLRALCAVEVSCRRSCLRVGWLR